MPVEPGDRVYVEQWELGRGISVAECKVEHVADGNATVRETKLFRVGNSEIIEFPGSQSCRTVPVSHLEQPINERLQRLDVETAQMISHFTPNA